MDPIYIISDLVIEYVNKNGAFEKTITDRACEITFDIELFPTEKIILFENDHWMHEFDKKRISPIIKSACPNLQKLIKVYKTYYRAA